MSTSMVSFAAVQTELPDNIVNTVNNLQWQQNDLEAEAIVIEVKQDKSLVNENPQLQFLLEVYPANEMPFRAEAKMRLPIGQLDLTQCGDRILVKYNPVDKTQVALASFHLTVPQTYTKWPMVGDGVDSWLCRQ